MSLPVIEPLLPERSNLVPAWIRLHHCEPGTPRYEEDFWAFMMMCDLVSDHPQDAWLMILEILATDPSPRIMQNLSAGPLEDLLAMHGERFIFRVEEEARRDPVFRKLLGGVWQNSMTVPVWSRVQAVWDRKGWDGIPEESDENSQHRLEVDRPKPGTDRAGVAKPDRFPGRTGPPEAPLSRRDGSD